MFEKERLHAKSMQHALQAAVAQPGVMEEAAAAAHQWQTRIRGAQRLAYPTVAGSGPNATYIHYSRRGGAELRKQTTSPAFPVFPVSARGAAGESA